MILKLIILALPSLALAGINVELSGIFEQNVQIGLSGHDVDVISNVEIDSFDLSSRNLKTGVEGYFGKWPTDVYVKSPTPWGDLYSTYGWQQVTRTLIPVDSRIVSMSSHPQVIMHQIFENKSTQTAKFDVGISQSLQNMVSSSWDWTKGLNVGETITVGIVLAGFNASSSTSIEYAANWGTNEVKSQSVTVGATSNLNIMLKPGQTVIAQLDASRGSMKVEVDYEATLSGDVATNYEKPYKGHHFWALPVRPIMEKADLTNSVKSRQTIEYSFYVNSKIIVYDKETEETIIEVQY